MKLLRGIVKDVRRELKSEKAIKNVQRFLLVFLATFVFLYFVVAPLVAPVWYGAGVFSAGSANWLLNSLGFDTVVRGNVIIAEVDGAGYDFVVSRLCSGDIEIALLVSLLLASFDVLLSWRIVGSLVGIAGILLLNPIRIAVTLGLTKKVGLTAGDVAHSVIFRVFLFVFLVAYYFAWYNMCKGRRPFKLKRLKLWKWKRGS